MYCIVFSKANKFQLNILIYNVKSIAYFTLQIFKDFKTGIINKKKF